MQQGAIAEGTGAGSQIRGSEEQCCPCLISVSHGALSPITTLASHAKTDSFLKELIDLFTMYEYLPACLYLYHELEEARRGYGIPWNRNLHVA